MKIQNLLLPKIGVCTEEQLFFRKEEGYSREVELRNNRTVLWFKEKGLCTFDTYFNGLSIDKWKKYTTVGNISLVLILKGKFEVALTNSERINGKVYTKIVGCQTIVAEEKTTLYFPYKLYEFRGMLAFSIQSQEDGSEFYGGWYDAEVDEEALWETNIAINICTFKREPFVLRNIDILHSSIIDHPDNPLYGHLQIYISDNGKSLPKQRLNNETVHIVENKNVGGAGGFTRGLIEIMHNSEKFAATHALMMDDDVIIEPEALFRTYSLLRCRKQEYEDLFVGGAMLRLDNQAIQVESGASWNAGRLVSNKSNWDLCKLDVCLLNEYEEYVEYNAWWYCCTPMQVVTAENLPLPIFIRGDDLEYGLRNMKHLALMNGICVWHEAFENKYSSFLQYYILRNLLYDNSLHFEKYKLREFLVRLYKNVAREVVYYRYKNVALIFRGVKDFLKGVEFLKTTDGEALHRQIMEEGYKAVPVDQLKGVAFRIDDYKNSMEESESKIQKLWRFITLNGYLLPAKRMSENHMKVVSMAQCRPINFYRAKQVLNYDPASKKGFVTEKNRRQAIGIGFKLIGMTIEIMLHFTKAKREFKRDVAQITNESFWEKYLSM